MFPRCAELRQYGVRVLDEDQNVCSLAQVQSLEVAPESRSFVDGDVTFAADSAGGVVIERMPLKNLSGPADIYLQNSAGVVLQGAIPVNLEAHVYVEALTMEQSGSVSCRAGDHIFLRCSLTLSPPDA